MNSKLKSYDLYRVRGKLPPIQEREGIEPIKDIYIIEYTKNKFPTLFMQGNSKSFLGIILARQSSDFLALIAQKRVKEGEIQTRYPISVVQYPFPTYSIGTSLLALTPWLDVEELEPIFSYLRTFQKSFRSKLRTLLE
ncbi:MAG: hypothetical protein KAR20_13950 [Candidatus Heimdallarchaeota archaeon]|nr:hypothetical protein [Candidatus Heimdallarchaeota archaeon]